MSAAFQTVSVETRDRVSILTLTRPGEGNTITDTLIAECRQIVRRCATTQTALVIQGSSDVFCLGADLKSVRAGTVADADALYELWLELGQSSFVSVAHVRGKVAAGGVGFVAACDIVVADPTAQFSLTELLFGLCPACVMPFLIRRVGLQRAQYLALSTMPVSAQDAYSWGLIDALGMSSDQLLNRHLMRLGKLDKLTIERHKQYVQSLDDWVVRQRSPAVSRNREMFADRQVQMRIAEFVERGTPPWER